MKAAVGVVLSIKPTKQNNAKAAVGGAVSREVRVKTDMWLEVGVV